MMKKIISGFALATTIFTLGAFLSACAPKSQSDCGFVQNVYGERISWKGQLPIRMYIHHSVPREFVSSIYNAAKTWEESAGKKLFDIVDGEPTNDLGESLTSQGAKKDDFNIITYESTWDVNKKTEQGRTSLYWKGDTIKEADIKINHASDSLSGTSYFSYYVGQATSPQQVNFESLVLHEMGHVLGLKHKDSGGSVMATYLASNTERNQLASGDIVDLKCEY